MYTLRYLAAVLLNCLWVFSISSFKWMKIVLFSFIWSWKLLTQFPAPNEWKILLCMKNRRLPNLNYWINWAATTNYFRKLNDIPIGINMPGTVYVGSSITRVTTGGYGAIRVYYVIMGIVLAWDMSGWVRGSTCDVRFWRLKSIPTLKELQMYNSRRPLT